MADHVDPAPGAVELSLHGMGVGGEVAVRAHKDLCAHLPGEFQIKVLGEIIFVFFVHLLWNSEVEKDELKQAQDSKEKGNALFKEGNYEKASKYYERGISYLNDYHAGFIEQKLKYILIENFQIKKTPTNRKKYGLNYRKISAAATLSQGFK